MGPYGRLAEDFRTDLSEYLNFKHQLFKQVEFGTSGITSLCKLNT